MYHYRLSEIKLNIGESLDRLPGLAEKKLGLSRGTIDRESFEIRRESIDARDKSGIKLVYTVDFYTKKPVRALKNQAKNLKIVEDEAEEAPVHGEEPMEGRPVIVGFGPCGIFAALELARNGYRPIVLERGKAMEGRVEDVDAFRSMGALKPNSNMLFGEGGAGTFSDGKLTSGIKDGNIRYVLETFRDAGAGEDILYLHRPHIGTDVLREVIVNIRNEIIRLGGEVRFSEKLTGIEVMDGRLAEITVDKSGDEEDDSAGSQASTHRKGETAALASSQPGVEKTGCGDDHTYDEVHYSACIQPDKSNEYKIKTSALILATGHSARDTFRMIRDAGIVMEQKPLSIGVRMEHPQEMIDRSQYGSEDRLPPADYKVSCKTSNGRGVYSFCMCPGGEVVVCTTEEGELCVNGMSNRKRDSGTANSGILCDVRVSDYGSDDVLAGIEFQEKYEKLAYANGKETEEFFLNRTNLPASYGKVYCPPSCSMQDFISGTGNGEAVRASLPEFAYESIREAVPQFARKIHGYDCPDAIVTAVETRSSSPVRILRDENLLSNIEGIYPAGEGAGYAGGITSAACDGIKVARGIMSKYREPK